MHIASLVVKIKEDYNTKAHLTFNLKRQQSYVCKVSTAGIWDTRKGLPEEQHLSVFCDLVCLDEFLFLFLRLMCSHLRNNLFQMKNPDLFWLFGGDMLTLLL